MPTTCLLCCEQQEYFLLPPCNHKQMCWKCCLKLIEGSTFSCPYCGGTPDGCAYILFVEEGEMLNSSHEQVLRKGAFQSTSKSYQYYSNKNVATFIEEQLSLFCKICSQVFQHLNGLKKHLNEIHRKQYCDVCIDNRKCLLSEQILYSETELNSHLKKGQYSKDGELILYHPHCDFCRLRFYDSDAFRMHLRVSSHLKCDLCASNFPQFKYVYYRDYDQIEKHFKKTHFVCEVGACVAKKFQNVFISEDALEEHKNRVHQKFKGKNVPVNNILLFNKGVEQEMEWDKIGKNFEKQFTMIQKNIQLNNEEHRNQLIDIRQFYAKNGNSLTLRQIQQKLNVMMSRNDYKNDSISINSILFFCPLELPSLSRNQLQKMIRRVFDLKLAQNIILTFFTRKNQYRSVADYLNDVKRQMCRFSPIAYFYVYPQLIRFMKDENPNKKQMDQIYSQSLRTLKINRQFTFHQKEYYSDILQLMQQKIHQYMFDQIIQQIADLSKYKTYLSTMSIKYYQQHYKDLFYVQKEKMINLYHMVQKCKTKDLLKLSWLIKVGFSMESQAIINDQFYFKTVEECGKAITKLTYQQISLLYAYIGICLEALCDSKTFKIRKVKTGPLFMSDMIARLPKCISDKERIQIENIQRKSQTLSAQVVVKDAYNKKRVVYQEDHPSLLTKVENPAHKIEQKKQSFVIGGNYRRQWNEENIRKPKVTPKYTEQADEYPSLMGKKLDNKSGNIVDQDEFPVLPFVSPNGSKKKKQFLEDGEKKEQNFFTNHFTRKWDQDRRAEEMRVGNQLKQVIIGKKSKNIDDQVLVKKGKKGKKNNPTDEKEKKQQIPQIIQMPQVKTKVRLDMTDSQEEQRQRKEQKKKERERKRKKFEEQQKLRETLRYSTGFQSILQSNPANNTQSIVNKIVRDARVEEKEPEIRIKNGKKGKKVIIEKVDLSKL